MSIKTILIHITIGFFVSYSFASKQDKVISEQYQLIEKNTTEYLQLSQSIKDEYSVAVQIHQQCDNHLKNTTKECHQNCDSENYEKLKKDQLICYRHFDLAPIKINLLRLEVEQLQNRVKLGKLSKLKKYQLKLISNLDHLKHFLDTLQASEKKLTNRYLNQYQLIIEKQMTNQYIQAKLKGKKSAICEFIKFELNQLPAIISANQETISTIYWYDLLFKYRFYKKLHPRFASFCGNQFIGNEIQSALSFLEKKSTQLSKKVFLTECHQSIYESFTEQKCESIQKMTPTILSLLMEKMSK